LLLVLQPLEPQMIAQGTYQASPPFAWCLAQCTCAQVVSAMVSSHGALVSRETMLRWILVLGARHALTHQAAKLLVLVSGFEHQWCHRRCHHQWCWQPHQMSDSRSEMSTPQAQGYHRPVV